MLVQLVKIRQAFLLTIIFTCIILSIIYIHIWPVIQNDENFDTKEKTETKYPGSFVKTLHTTPSNYSYCNFNYGFPDTFQITENDIKYPVELGEKSDFRVIYDVVEAKVSDGVTYATQLSVDFSGYVAELARSYDGPISVAAFAPSTDATKILNTLHQLCQCLPEMSRVSVHFVFNKKQPPIVKPILEPPKNCSIPDSQRYTSSKIDSIYPINVCRNVARFSSKTKFVLVSDVQLIPSDGLSRKFLEMIEKYDFNPQVKMVFVLPIFEVEAFENVPTTKKDLLVMLKSNTAVYFHKMICTHCQKFPGLEKWLDGDPGEGIVPILTTKREVPYQRWEPIYIGTNAEPLYSEVLSWEGMQDKMLQMLELCLLDYKFVILDGAFLVHWPGVKKKKMKDDWRNKFKLENSRQYKRILNDFLRRYGNKPQCKAE